MAAITQFVPTFLGGVSRQADTKKFPGQVNEIINGYPDPTYGLLKRGGAKYIGNVASYVDDESDSLKDGYWFAIDRDNDERYAGVITKSGDIRIWNTVPVNTGGVLTFTEATVANKTNPNVVAYLTTPAGVSTLHNFHTFYYLDRSYIVNKSTTVTMSSKTPYYLKTRATVVIGSIDYDQEYSVYINGTKCSFKTISITDAETREEPVDADEILVGLKAAIDAAVGTTFTTTKYSNSLEIEINDGVTPFSIEVDGGVQGVSLTVYQDEVTTPTRLAAYTKPGRRVKILNTIDDRSSYFVKFVGTGGATVVSGSGNYEESLGWDIDIDNDGNPIQTGGQFIAQLAANSLTANTMPFKLVNTDTNQFEISTEEWSPRLTGNDFGNPIPTFVNNQIKFGLVYSNRLTFMTNDSIVMSVAKDFQNFFFTSSQTIIASDPIDLETTSTKVSNLYCAVPQAQGLVLFSEFEQYLLFSESGILSPSDAILRTISQYEADRKIEASDVGDFVAFVSPASTYSRLMGMQPRGTIQSAAVSDVSKVVADYLPDDVRYLRVNTADSLLALLSKNKNTIYLYKYYAVDGEASMQAWFSWKLAGDVQNMFIINNYLLAIVRAEGQYRGVLIDIVQDFSKPDEVTYDNVRIDHSFVVKAGGTITYDILTDKSTIPKPYANIPNQKPVVFSIPEVEVGPSTDYDNLYVETGAPSTITPNLILEVEIDESGDWLIDGDWTGKEFELCAGYEFDFDVELPRLFYRTQNNTDWTASLTIARINFDVAFSGFVDFYTKRHGSTEWKLHAGIQFANYYTADGSPTIDRTILTVPIHQKNTNYDLRINSRSPFPLALNNMSWEGNYTSRFYRRA